MTPEEKAYHREYERMRYATDPEYRRKRLERAKARNVERKDDPEHRERRREYMREWRQTEAGQAAVRRSTEMKAIRRGQGVPDVRGARGAHKRPETVAVCPEAKLLAGSYMCACHGLGGGA